MPGDDREFWLCLLPLLVCCVGVWVFLMVGIARMNLSNVPEPEQVDEPMPRPRPERIGDPLPAPPGWLLDEAERVGIGKAADRPWIPAPHPLGGKCLRMGCSCSGRLEFRRCCLRHADGAVVVWLGQCSKCESVFWSVEM